jgi:uncharacterized protein YceH (UPF0502 family)
MVQLTSDECRVLGVLVEKAHTVASQYPMSLNSIVVGCNQKSNRHPVMAIDEDRAVAALEGLRDKHLVLFADTAGSRVMKYRHNCREALDVGTNELVVLVELLLRGPQTGGEIRTRASRMHPLGSLDEVQNLLKFMMDRESPLVRRVEPAPGSRAQRYAQLLCPHLHRLDEPAGEDAPDDSAPAATAGGKPGLASRVEMLEGDVMRLRRVVEQLANALGETDILRALEAPPGDEQAGADATGGRG